MTTKPQGITLPSYTNQQFLVTGVQTTDVTGNYASNNAYQYGPATVAPVNLTAAASTSPSSLVLQAQNAAVSVSAQGGNVVAKCGIGTNGNSSGNLVIQDTTGAGGAYNNSHLVIGTWNFWVDAKGRLRLNAGASATDLTGNVVGIDLSNTGAYTPGTLTTLQSVSTTLTVAGAVLGDLALVSFSLDTLGCIVTARVSSANTVTVIFYNPTNASIVLTVAGTLSVKVIKQ